MALLFSTAYEGSLFKDDINKENRYVGTTTLLSLFERDLGLFQEYPSNEFRLKAYMDSLKECSKGSFYSASFNSSSSFFGGTLRFTNEAFLPDDLRIKSILYLEAS